MAPSKQADVEMLTLIRLVHGIVALAFLGCRVVERRQVCPGWATSEYGDDRDFLASSPPRSFRMCFRFASC
jgi:hypothetical protein